MVAAATLRGLLGIAVSDGGRTLRFAPELPADWDHVAVSNVAAGDAHYDVTLERSGSGGIARETIRAMRSDRSAASSTGGTARVIIAPAFPLDASIKSVFVNGRAAKFNVVRAGDVQRADVELESAAPKAEVRFEYIDGTDVYLPREPLKVGARSEGLRIVRSHADRNALHLTLEGLGGREYALSVRTGRQLGKPTDVTIQRIVGKDPQLLVSFPGPSGVYVRRELSIPLFDRVQ